MFRRLADRINSAISSEDHSQSDIITLTEMGFSYNEAQIALEASNGDVTQAANHLLLSTTPTTVRQAQQSYTKPQPQQRQTGTTEADDIQKAINLSLEQQTQTQSKTKPQPKPKIPPKLQDKSREEQIKRCTLRIQPHSKAVDTLIKALKAIHNNPSNQKYRRIDTSTKGFQSTLANVPGVIDLLTCCHFKRDNQYYILDRLRMDMALIWMAYSSLEQCRTSPEYLSSKSKFDFEAHLEQMLDSTSKLRQNQNIPKQFLLLSSEPDKTQRSSLITINFTSNHVKKRRFHPDDTLQDVIAWIGNLAPGIVENLLTKQWTLVDQDVNPIKGVNVDQDLKKTLQVLGWWPSGRLGIVDGSCHVQMKSFSNGSSRGLGVPMS